MLVGFRWTWSPYRPHKPTFQDIQECVWALEYKGFVPQRCHCFDIPRIWFGVHPSVRSPDALGSQKCELRCCWQIPWSTCCSGSRTGFWNPTRGVKTYPRRALPKAPRGEIWVEFFLQRLGGRETERSRERVHARNEKEAFGDARHRVFCGHGTDPVF